MCAVGQDQQTRIGVGDSSIGAGLGAGGGGGAFSTFLGGPDAKPGDPKQGWTRNAVLVGQKRVTQGVTADTPGAVRSLAPPRQGGSWTPEYSVTEKLYK